MQFSVVLVALLATSSFAAPAPIPAGNAAAPAPKPVTGKPTKPTEPNDPANQDPTKPESQEPTAPDSQEPTDPGNQQPTEPGNENPTGEEATPETTGNGAPSCSRKRDLSNLFGLLRRGCDGTNIVVPPGTQGPKNPADIPPYKAPTDAEVKQYMVDVGNYQSGKPNNPANARMREINMRYINRIARDGDVQLYAGDGKDGAMIQSVEGDRLNVGQAYQNYDEGFFDPNNEPAKSILATGDKTIIQNFFASTSADFVTSAQISPDANGNPTGTVVLSATYTDEQLATLTGKMGFKLIFTTDENPAAIAHPGVRFMTKVDPAVAEIFLPDTAPALAVVANPDLASDPAAADSATWRKGNDGKIYRKMAQGWMPVEVMWDKLGVFGPKSWP